MGIIENYRLISVRRVSVYPDIMLEGKIEVVQENANKKRFIYLVFDIDEVSNITEETDYWCYLFPFDEMFDNTEYIYDLTSVDAIPLMRQIEQIWKS